MTLEETGQRAVKASRCLISLTEKQKNEVLKRAAENLRTQEAQRKILEANAQDLCAARERGMKESLLDRLQLTGPRICAMAQGLEQIAGLKDPIGEVLFDTVRPNGLHIVQTRVPFGVIGIIYESRPNVTADAFGLCFKTGNAVILRGGSDCLASNIAITAVLRQTLAECGTAEDAVQLLEDTSRETVRRLMRMNEYVDLLIPRGGAGLIRSVVENSTVPVIETGTGNCHVYVDAAADLNMACEIVFNAKTQRTGVCNACESLLIHEAVLQPFLEKLCSRLAERPVELRCDPEALAAAKRTGSALPLLAATEEDWGEEYLDYILSVKTVGSVSEAVSHINRYNTRHSETIVTEDETAAETFLNGVDAAVVYWNASTRFTDGFEFGFGAEIGISTQKLHARGPMGLKELTTTKYRVYGHGQVRG